MKIDITRHELLKGIVSKNFIYDHRNDEGKIFNKKGFKVVIERDDQYNIFASFIDQNGEVVDGVFEVLATIDY